MNREEIGIIEGLLLASWDNIQNQQFIVRYQVGLILHPPAPIYEDLQVLHTVKNMELDWAVDEQIYSKCILKIKCCDLMGLFKVTEDNCQTVVVGDFGITSKSIGICCLLVMVKFGWSLLKTLQYMSKKVPTMDMDDTQIRSLLLYDKSLRQNLLQQTTEIWEIEQETCEESILARNTFLNSLKLPALDQLPKKKSIRVKKKVSFQDEQQLNATRVRSLSQMPTKFSERQYQPSRHTQQQPTMPKIRYKTSLSLKPRQKHINLYMHRKLNTMVSFSSQQKTKILHSSLCKLQTCQLQDQPQSQCKQPQDRFCGMLSRIKQRLDKRFLVSNPKHVHREKQKKLMPYVAQANSRRVYNQIKGIYFATKQKPKLNKLIGSSLQNIP